MPHKSTARQVGAKGVAAELQRIHPDCHFCEIQPATHIVQQQPYSSFFRFRQNVKRDHSLFFSFLIKIRFSYPLDICRTLDDPRCGCQVDLAVGGGRGTSELEEVKQLIIALEVDVARLLASLVLLRSRERSRFEDVTWPAGLARDLNRYCVHIQTAGGVAAYVSISIYVRLTSAQNASNSDIGPRVQLQLVCLAKWGSDDLLKVERRVCRFSLSPITCL